jgi:hypothetical protein
MRMKRFKHAVWVLQVQYSIHSMLTMYCTHCPLYSLHASSQWVAVWVLQRRWQSILTNRKYAHLIVQCKRVQHWYRKRIIAKRVKKFKAEDLLYD